MDHNLVSVVISDVVLVSVSVSLTEMDNNVEERDCVLVVIITCVAVLSS